MWTEKLFVSGILFHKFKNPVSGLLKLGKKSVQMNLFVACILEILVFYVEPSV